MLHNCKAIASTCSETCLAIAPNLFQNYFKVASQLRQNCFNINNHIQFWLQSTVFGIPGVSGANAPQLVAEESRYQKGIQGKQSLEENHAAEILKRKTTAIAQVKTAWPLTNTRLIKKPVTKIQMWIYQFFFLKKRPNCLLSFYASKSVDDKRFYQRRLDKRIYNMEM